jgi:hypothetical protein
MGKERKVVPITIRFKPHIVDELKSLADEENRSINGTVVEAVERYIRARRGRQPKDTQDAR